MAPAPSVPSPGDSRPWEDAWQEALYGPAGFYRGAPPARHFATSAQGIPGGTEVLAAALVELARRHGCSRVVDVGAGAGELLAGIRALAPGLHLTAVDVVDRRDSGAVDEWLVAPGGAALPDALTGLTDSLVVAHEWLDVVPCPVVEREGADQVWRTVAATSDGTETLGAPVAGEALAWLERWVPPHVHRAEVGLPRDRAAADLLGRIGTGVLVVVDYGTLRDTRPPTGTLTGFRDGRQVDPVPDGSCDVTAHLAVDSLVDHVRSAHPVDRPEVCRQREVLPDLLPGAGAPVPHELARRAPTAYLRALARRAALHTLCAPGGLGDFWWVVLPRRGEARQ